MKNTMRVFLYVLITVLAASACTVAPAPTTVPPTSAQTFVPTATRRPTATAPAPSATPVPTATSIPATAEPAGQIYQMQMAVPLPPYHFDKGLEAAYHSGFQQLKPAEFVERVLIQLNMLKQRYPGAAKGIDVAISSAEIYAYQIRAQFLIAENSVGRIPTDKEIAEVMTVARAFNLARTYLRLKLVDWATFLRVGSASLNSVPLVFPNPAILCQPELRTNASIYFCGLNNGTLTAPQ